MNSHVVESNCNRQLPAKAKLVTFSLKIIVLQTSPYQQTMQECKECYKNAKVYSLLCPALTKQIKTT